MTNIILFILNILNYSIKFSIYNKFKNNNKQKK